MHTSLFGGVERSHYDSPSLTASQCVGVGERNALLPNKVGSPGTPHRLHRQEDGEEAHYCLVGMKIPASYLASLTPPQQGLGVPCYTRKDRSLGSSLSLCCYGWFFMWGVAAIKWLFPGSFLLSTTHPFPTPLGREGRLWLSVFFFFFFFLVFGFYLCLLADANRWLARWLASSAPSLGHVKTKKIQGTHNLVSL